MLVMAALLMADEIAELRAKLETTITECRLDAKLGNKLNHMAKRAEEIADNIERPLHVRQQSVWTQ